VRGNAVNDVAACGAFGDLLHFNGSTWREYTGRELPVINGSYYRVAMNQTTIITVGWWNDKAVAVVGKRQK
jgi:hypothetical protein